MTTLLVSLVDAAIVLGLGLAVVLLMRRSAASLRHAVLAAVIGCALAMPLFELVLPQVPIVPWSGGAAWSSGMTLTSEAFSPSSTNGADMVSARPPTSWLQIFVAVWLSGAVVLGLILAASFVRLRRLLRRCDPVTGRWRELTDTLARECGVDRHVGLLQSRTPSLLVTCGLFHPAIVLPAGAETWPEDRCRVVLRHELAHIRRHDAGLQILGEMLRVVQWINPLVWLACRRLRQESEYACDDAVLAGGVEATDYAAHLLDVARDLSGRHPVWVSAPAIAQPSTLERRIVAMLQRHRNRAPLGRRGWAFAAVAAFGISVPLASAGLVHEPTTVVVASPAPDVPLAAPTAQQPAPAPAPVVLATRVTPRQENGSISGTIIDQTGGTVPGVRVALSNPAAGINATLTTDASGQFGARGLPAGDYELVATLPGFATVTNLVKLATGQNVQGSLTLPLGTLQETITVACAGPSAEVQRRFPGNAVFPMDAGQPRVITAVYQSPIRVGGNVRPPKKLTDVKPACPSAPSAETVVRLTGRIGTDGNVYDIAAVSPPSGAEAFVDAASSALSRWKFTPTLLNGQPMDVNLKVMVTFVRQ